MNNILAFDPDIGPREQNKILENINKYYEYREIIREIYNKAELIGDLNGKIFNIRDNFDFVTEIKTDLKANFVSIAIPNKNTESMIDMLDLAISGLRETLLNFITEYYYMSANIKDSVDFMHWLACAEIFDVIQADAGDYRVAYISL